MSRTAALNYTFLISTNPRVLVYLNSVTKLLMWLYISLNVCDSTQINVSQQMHNEPLGLSDVFWTELIKIKLCICDLKHLYPQ